MAAINSNFISNSVKKKKKKNESNYLNMCSFCLRNLFNQVNQRKTERWIEWSNIFFRMGNPNSCGVFIAFFASKSVTITKE